MLAGFQMAADTGAIVGPVLAGALAESVGFPAAFGVTAAVTLLGLLFWLRAPETWSRSRTPEPTPSPSAPRATAASARAMR